MGAVRLSADRGLVRRGVDVTLFATADSVTTAHLVGTAPTGYSEDPALDAKVWEALHISAVFDAREQDRLAVARGGLRVEDVFTG